MGPLQENCPSLIMGLHEYGWRWWVGSGEKDLVIKPYRWFIQEWRGARESDNAAEEMKANCKRWRELKWIVLARVSVFAGGSLWGWVCLWELLPPLLYDFLHVQIQICQHHLPSGLEETEATVQDKFLSFLNLEYRSSTTTLLWEKKKADIQEQRQD